MSCLNCSLRAFASAYALSWMGFHFFSAGFYHSIYFFRVFSLPCKQSFHNALQALFHLLAHNIAM
jgi:hypothetical protein